MGGDDADEGAVEGSLNTDVVVGPSLHEGLAGGVVDGVLPQHGAAFAQLTFYKGVAFVVGEDVELLAAGFADRYGHFFGHA